MDQATIEKWGEKDLWSEKELEELCCGLEPNGARPCTEELNEAGEAIRRGIISKALPCICPSDATAGDHMYGHARFFRPVDAIKWASPKYASFPFKAKRQDGGNEQLTKERDAKIDRPLETRQRRTYLTIIAAMCKHEGLIPKERGTAQRIKEMTDELGAPVDDGTIATMLAEIPDALESRMK